VVWPGRNAPAGRTADPRIGLEPDRFYAPIREAMGMTLTYANRMNLAAMTPQPSLCSTHFCLANPGTEYLVYQPYAGPVSVNLGAGTYHYEWLDPTSNRITSFGVLSVSKGDHTFTPAYKNDAILYLSHEPNQKVKLGSSAAQ
jgi:hypothetical protein